MSHCPPCPAILHILVLRPEDSDGTLAHQLLILSPSTYPVVFQAPAHSWHAIRLFSFHNHILQDLQLIFLEVHLLLVLFLWRALINITPLFFLFDKACVDKERK